MTDFSVKARAACDVAPYLRATTVRPDLILSTGCALPDDARELVFAPDGMFKDVKYAPHCMSLALPNGITTSEDDVRHVMLRAIELDRHMHRVVGHTPNILLHCEQGQTRSVMVAMAIYGGRMLRAEPSKPVWDVIDNLYDMLDQSIDLPDLDKIARDQPITSGLKTKLASYLQGTLKAYQKKLPEPGAPVRSARKPAGESALTL